MLIIILMIFAGLIYKKLAVRNEVKKEVDINTLEPAFELGPGWTIHKYVQTFDVYKKDKLVAKIKAQSGYLTSTALLPPGTPPQKHPFITASVLVPEEENNLSQLLKGAKDFNEYLSLLKEDGYVVFLTRP